MSEQTYVVQRSEMVAVGTDAPYVAWRDIATVTVPPKSKRSTVLREALKQAGIKPGGDALELRALDARSTAVTWAKPDAPEPQWELS